MKNKVIISFLLVFLTFFVVFLSSGCKTDDESGLYSKPPTKEESLIRAAETYSELIVTSTEEPSSSKASKHDYTGVRSVEEIIRDIRNSSSGIPEWITEKELDRVWEEGGDEGLSVLMQKAEPVQSFEDNED